MKVIIHDLGAEYTALFEQKADSVIHADGRYAPCQGCFGCWTKHPMQCMMKDKLQYASRLLAQADEMTIVTKNCYGSYSPAVKNVLDRAISSTTPLSWFRGGDMHHVLRKGGGGTLLRVIVYGSMTQQERDTFTLMAQRNAHNDGFARAEVVFAGENPQWKELIA